MVLICIIPQFSSTERSGSTDPAVFCLCMYTLATLALNCSSVLAMSVCVLHLVSCYCEWIFNEAMASSAAVLSGSESVENSLSVSAICWNQWRRSEIPGRTSPLQHRSLHSARQRVALTDSQAKSQVMKAAQYTLHSNANPSIKLYP